MAISGHLKAGIQGFQYQPYRSNRRHRIDLGDVSASKVGDELFFQNLVAVGHGAGELNFAHEEVAGARPGCDGMGPCSRLGLKGQGFPGMDMVLVE